MHSSNVKLSKIDGEIVDKVPVVVVKIAPFLSVLNICKLKTLGLMFRLKKHHEDFRKTSSQFIPTVQSNM